MNTNNQTKQTGYATTDNVESKIVNLASDTSLHRRVIVKSGEIDLPQQNIDHIATLALAGELDGREKVVAYAADVAGKLYGPELTELQTTSRQAHDNLAGVQKQICELTKILNSTRRYNETDRQSEPWTWFDKLQTVVLALVSIVLMLVGINSMATVLLESGIAAFENPYCRYLFSMIPLALPFAFKYLSRQFSTTKGRALYHTALWLLGIALAIVWAFLFASTFNGITQSASDLAGALTLNAGEGTASDHKWVLMAISILVESLLAAGCWLTIETIVEKHESSIRVANPAYEHTQTELNHWRTLEAEEDDHLGKVDGRIKAIQDAISKYIADADGIYVGKKFAMGSREEVNRILDGKNPLTNGSPKRRRTAVIPIVVALLLCVGSAHIAAVEKTFVFGIAADYERQDKELVYQKLIHFALEGASPGDEIAVYDALGLRPIAIMHVPEGTLFRNNARARLQRMQKEIATLKRFFVANMTVLPPNKIGLINVPEFLALVSTHVRRSGEQTVVILIGSAFHVDDEGNFSMTDAFPSDAHLAVDQRESAFGVTLKKQALTGVTVHYAYLHESFLNDYHKERTGRFWSLFVSEQQGVLSSFASNLDLVVGRARDDVRQPFMTARLDPNDSKIEMRHIAARPVPAWFPTTKATAPFLETNSPSVSPLSAAPVVPTNVPSEVNPVRPDQTKPVQAVITNSSVPVVTQTNDLPASPRKTDQRDSLPVAQPASETGLGIGIIWNMDGCDLDLYVKPYPSARELYFRNRSTPEGKYFHDYRNRNDKLDFEYVELASPVDIQTVKAWVNFYKGRIEHAKGVVVVRYRGSSYTAEFTLKATQGNFGRDASTRGTTPYWVELDIANIIGTAGIAGKTDPQFRSHADE